jgi:hypothetical protein
MPGKAGLSALWEREPVANDEHLALLRQGCGIWNVWRERNPGTRLEFRRADLSETDLIGVNLSEVNLSRANLNKANLNKANLNKANLHTANLTGAVLIEADLSGADLSAATLRGANLGGASLREADLIEADLRGANLRGADLIEAHLYKTALAAADLSGTSLFETIFVAVDLTGTRGLNDCRHLGPSAIDFRTLSLSENLPISFLRGCGLADNLIDYLPSLRSEAIQFYSCFISIRQMIRCSPIGSMPICRTKAFDAGSRRTISP